MRTRTVWRALLIFLVTLPALFLLLARNSLHEFEGLCPGDMLPGATLQTVQRVRVETGSWRGSPTVLVVFQPGCEACRLQIRTLASIAPSFPKVKFVLLSTENGVEGMQTPFPIYLDPHGAFLRKVRKLVTPALYWIDASGRVRYARTGQGKANEEEQILRRFLEANPGSSVGNEPGQRMP
jgi:hypothetical protein